MCIPYLLPNIAAPIPNLDMRHAAASAAPQVFNVYCSAVTAGLHFVWVLLPCNAIPSALSGCEWPAGRVVQCGGGGVPSSASGPGVACYSCLSLLFPRFLHGNDEVENSIEAFHFLNCGAPATTETSLQRRMRVTSHFSILPSGVALHCASSCPNLQQKPGQAGVARN